MPRASYSTVKSFDTSLLGVRSPNPTVEMATVYCPGSGHAPHHVPSEWADKYKGVFDEGYEKYAEDTFKRMKKMGIIPPGTELAPMNSMSDARSSDGKPWPEADTVRPWDSLDDDERRLFIRMAEVFAGYESFTDHHVGRILDHLEELGELENTMIIVASDNGASGEGGPDGSFNENLWANGIPDTIQENLKYIDELGGTKTYNHYANGWAQAFCTPYKMYKRFTWNGGICDPLIISWPKQIADQGGLRSQYCHVSDIASTIYEAVGVEYPEEVKGYTQWPLEGTSIAYTFDDEDADTRKQTQFYSVLGSRAIYHKGWKATTVHPSIGGWGNFSSDEWELFNVEEDPSEMFDLSKEQPERLQELINIWFSEAGKHNGFPLDDRTATEQMSGTERPQMSAGGDRYVYFPGTLEVPETDAVSTRGRSWKFTVELALDDDPSGVIFAQGSQFGGYSMFAKNKKLHFVYNFVGLEEQTIVSDQPLPSGKCTAGIEYEMEGMSKERASAHGKATLFINEQAVGDREIKTQLAKFAIAGEGFAVGRSAGSPVTNNYPGSHPWAFTGGEIYRVVADVSGESYVDLEKEAVAAMKRD